MQPIEIEAFSEIRLLAEKAHLYWAKAAILTKVDFVVNHLLAHRNGRFRGKPL